MYSISQVAKETGFTSHTLRYYEKIGLLITPTRQSGKRIYSEGDVRLLKFIKLLKNTGMPLDDIQEFLVDGCLLESNEPITIRNIKVQKRLEILQKHLLTLQQQREEIDMVINLTNEKLKTYEEMLKREQK